MNEPKTRSFRFALVAAALASSTASASAAAEGTPPIPRPPGSFESAFSPKPGPVDAKLMVDACKTLWGP